MSVFYTKHSSAPVAATSSPSHLLRSDRHSGVAGLVSKLAGHNRWSVQPPLGHWAREKSKRPMQHLLPSAALFICGPMRATICSLDLRPTRLGRRLVDLARV